MLFHASTVVLSLLVLGSEAGLIGGIEGEVARRVPAWRRRHVGFESALVAREPQNNRQNGGGNNNFGGNKNNNNSGAKASSAKSSSVAAATSAKAAATPATGNNGNNGGNAGTNTNNNAAAGGGGGSACLSANAIQTGSTSDGQNPPVTGQSKSATDSSNFINFCSGQTLTNGLQNKAGSCNGIVMGKIPSTSNMVTSIITSPKPGENLAASTTFTVSVQTKGLAAGSFTNAQATYYAAPQDLNGGQIIGHTHLTIQDLGNSLAPTAPPDPVSFVFFKGVNDAGNGNGLLSATVTGGLPAGNYRVCSMNSASNHQPVIMPVAQRGAQDDCQKFTVGAANGGGNGGNANANAGNANTGNGGGKAAASSAASTKAAKATTSKKGKRAEPTPF